VELTLVAVIVVALFFDFTNGFHDTANSIATSVSTRALSPRLAVLTAAVLNFAGAFVSIKVAATVAKGIVDPEAITLKIVLGGLVADTLGIQAVYILGGILLLLAGSAGLASLPRPHSRRRNRSG